MVEGVFNTLLEVGETWEGRGTRYVVARTNNTRVAMDTWGP